MFTGFGILGHAQNLASNQTNEVSFVIHNLPIIAKMASVAKACGNMFQLLQGYSAETSGGLLITLPREQAAAYCKVRKCIKNKLPIDNGLILYLKLSSILESFL